MRVLRLAKVAAEAERIRLERLAKQIALRAAMGAVAATFGFLALLAVEVTIGFAFARIVAPLWAALIVCGINLIFALIFLGAAVRSPHDPVRVEARQVRDRALMQMRDAAAMTVLVAPLGRLLGKRNVYGLALTALATRIFAALRR